jgi:pyruvate/2-oxoglutarate dehydrogenase complex dihydrolipoamide acyltransferase (E2) component
VRTTKPAKAKPAATAATTAKAPKPPKPQRAARPAPDPAALQARLDRMRWIPAILLAAALLAVLGLGVWQSHGVWWGKRIGDSRSIQKEQQQVLAAAKTCAVRILSYDYRKLDANRADAESCIGGDFKTQYQQTYQVVLDLAPQKKGVQNLELSNGGIQSVSKDAQQWTVLLYGQIAYADSTTKPDSPRLDIATFVATVTKTGGKWLVTALNPTG